MKNQVSELAYVDEDGHRWFFQYDGVTREDHLEIVRIFKEQGIL